MKIPFNNANNLKCGFLIGNKKIYIDLEKRASWNPKKPNVLKMIGFDDKEKYQLSLVFDFKSVEICFQDTSWEIKINDTKTKIKKMKGGKK